MISPNLDRHPLSTLIDTVSDATFTSQVLEARDPIAVEFMSYGCSHCRIMEPVLQQAALEVRDRVRVVRVNIANDAVLATRYGVRGTPTFVMFRNGEEVGRIEGAHPTLRTMISVLTESFTA